MRVLTHQSILVTNNENAAKNWMYILLGPRNQVLPVRGADIQPKDITVREIHISNAF